MKKCLLLVLLPLLSGGLGAQGDCDKDLQQKYCQAWYGGDYHTACLYCGRGQMCPPGRLSGRTIQTAEIRDEILHRHNEYRQRVRTGKGGMPATKRACLPPLKWDEELAEVAQVWADQCAMIIYPGQSYPRIFHEKSNQRTTSRFRHPPGVGQNVAWALTEGVNFTQIIDDLWYRDIRNLEPGLMDSFKIDASDSSTNLITQMLWGHTTHIGCGWSQIEVSASKWAAMYPSDQTQQGGVQYENYFVCNYGVGGNVLGQPVYEHPDCDTSTRDDDAALKRMEHSNIEPEVRQNSGVLEEKHTQFFKDFSVSVRTVIASCLQTINCLESTDTYQSYSTCQDLSNVCLLKGPQSTINPTGKLSRIQLECRIEQLLCISNTVKKDCVEHFNACVSQGDRRQINKEKETGAMQGLLGSKADQSPSFPKETSTSNIFFSTDPLRGNNGEYPDKSNHEVSLSKDRYEDIYQTTQSVEPTTTQTVSSLVNTQTSQRPFMIVTSTNMNKIQTSTDPPVDNEKNVDKVIRKDDNSFRKTGDDKVVDISLSTVQSTGSKAVSQKSTNSKLPQETIIGKEKTDAIDDLIKQVQENILKGLENNSEIITFPSNSGDLNDILTSIGTSNDTLYIFQDILVGPNGNFTLNPITTENEQNIPQDILNSINENILTAFSTTINNVTYTTPSQILTEDTTQLILTSTISNTFTTEPLEFETNISPTMGESLNQFKENILKDIKKKLPIDNQIIEEVITKHLSQLKNKDLQIIIDALEDGINIDTQLSNTKFNEKEYSNLIELFDILKENREDHSITNQTEDMVPDENMDGNIGQSNSPTLMNTMISKEKTMKTPPNIDNRESMDNTISSFPEPTKEIHDFSSLEKTDDDDEIGFSTPYIDSPRHTGPLSDFTTILPSERYKTSPGVNKDNIFVAQVNQNKQIPTTQTSAQQSVATTPKVSLGVTEVDAKDGTERSVLSQTTKETSDGPTMKKPFDLFSNMHSSTNLSPPDENVRIGTSTATMFNTERGFSDVRTQLDFHETQTEINIVNLNPASEVTISPLMDPATKMQELDSFENDATTMADNIRNSPAVFTDLAPDNSKTSEFSTHSPSRRYETSVRDSEEHISADLFNKNMEHTSTKNGIPVSQATPSAKNKFPAAMSVSHEDLNGKTETPSHVETIENSTELMMSVNLSSDLHSPHVISSSEVIPDNVFSEKEYIDETTEYPLKMEKGEDVERKIESILTTTVDDEKIEFIDLSKNHNDFDEENEENEKEGEECQRRYLDKTRLVDISYYNTTTRTRLLTGICLEGIRCKPEQDDTRCSILHSMCNQHIDTSLLTFSMRVTLSECTVEDVLCHLGHRTPVMCCQEKYSECVETLASHPVKMMVHDDTKPCKMERTKPLEINMKNFTESSEDNSFLYLLGIKDLADGENINSNGKNIIDKITEELFSTENSIIQKVSEGYEKKKNLTNETLISLDNETLAIFQDFLVIVDDSSEKNNTAMLADSTVNNIIANFNTNSNDFKIIFDPRSTQVGQLENIGLEEEEILNQIKNQINGAIENVAKVCSNNICIKNIDETEVRPLQIFNLNMDVEGPHLKTSTNTWPNESKQTEKTKTGSIILLEPKKDVTSQLVQCQDTLQCVDSLGCIFSQSRCLRLSGVDILPPEIRQKLAQCKIRSLKCEIRATNMADQKYCRTNFLDCSSKLGIDIFDNAVMNYVDTNHPEDFSEEEEQSISSNLLNDLLKNISSTLEDDLGKNYTVKVVPVSNRNEENASIFKTKKHGPANGSDILPNPSLVNILREENSHIIKVPSENLKNPSFDNILSAVKTKFYETSEPLSIILEDYKNTQDFEMSLPILGISISFNDRNSESDDSSDSIMEDSPISHKSNTNNNSSTQFGMSIPIFGFNITADTPDPSQCQLDQLIYNDFERVPSEDLCQICACNAGTVQCYTRQCPKSPSMDCRPVVIEGTCCVNYDCTKQGTENKAENKSENEGEELISSPSKKEDPPSFAPSEDLINMLDSIRNTLLEAINGSDTDLKPNYLKEKNKSEDELEEHITNKPKEDNIMASPNKLSNEPITVNTNDKKYVNNSEVETISNKNETIIHMGHEDNIFLKTMKESMDNILTVKSMLAENDVNIFLNFTYEENQSERDDTETTKVNRNFTEQILKVLNSGLGYILIPDGKKPEIGDEHPIHIVQTVKVGANDIIEIDTQLPNVSESSLSAKDKKLIRKVELKTINLINDILAEMEIKLNKLNESTPAKTGQSNSMNQKLMNENKINLGFSKINVEDVSLNLNLSGNSIRNSEIKGKLKAYIEKETGFETHISDTVDVMNKSNIYYITTKVNNKNGISIDIQLNDQPSDQLKEEDLRIVNSISKIVKVGIRNLIGNVQDLNLNDSSIISKNDLINNDTNDMRNTNAKESLQEITTSRTIGTVIDDKIRTKNPAHLIFIKINGGNTGKNQQKIENILREKIETETGISTEIIGDDNLDPLSVVKKDSYFVQGNILNNNRVITTLSKNKMPIDKLNGEDFTRAKNLQTIFEIELTKILKEMTYNDTENVNFTASTVTSGSENMDTAQSIPYNIIQEISNFIGLPLSNQASFILSPENKTLLVFKGEHNGSGNIDDPLINIDIKKIPKILKNQIFEALSNSNNDTQPSSFMFKNNTSLLPEPTIYLNISDNSGNPKTLQHIADLLSFLKEDTGIKSVKIGEKDIKDVLGIDEQNENDVIITGIIDKNNVITHKLSVGNTDDGKLSSAQNESAILTKSALNKGISKIFMEEQNVSNDNKGDQVESHNVNLISFLQDSIVSQLSNLPEIILLNDTNLVEERSNDTLLIFQDIIVDQDGNIKISTSTNGLNDQITPILNSLPKEIEDAIKSGINKVKEQEPIVQDVSKVPIQNDEIETIDMTPKQESNAKSDNLNASLSDGENEQDSSAHFVNTVLIQNDEIEKIVKTTKHESEDKSDNLIAFLSEKTETKGPPGNNSNIFNDSETEEHNSSSNSENVSHPGKYKPDIVSALDPDKEVGPYNNNEVLIKDSDLATSLFENVGQQSSDINDIAPTNESKDVLNSVKETIEVGTPIDPIPNFQVGSSKIPDLIENEHLTKIPSKVFDGFSSSNANTTPPQNEGIVSQLELPLIDDKSDEYQLENKGLVSVPNNIFVAGKPVNNSSLTLSEEMSTLQSEKSNNSLFIQEGQDMPLGDSDFSTHLFPHLKPDSLAGPEFETQVKKEITTVMSMTTKGGLDDESIDQGKPFQREEYDKKFLNTPKSQVDEQTTRETIISESSQDASMDIHLNNSMAIVVISPGNTTNAKKIALILKKNIKSSLGENSTNLLRIIINEHEESSDNVQDLNLDYINITVDDNKISVTEDKKHGKTSSSNQQIQHILSVVEEEVEKFNNAPSIVVDLNISGISSIPEDGNKLKDKIDKLLKEIVEEHTGVETYILIDKTDKFIEDLKSELGDFYLLPVDVKNANEITKGTAVNNLPNDNIGGKFEKDLVGLEAHILESVKEVFHWEYFSDENIEQTISLPNTENMSSSAQPSTDNLFNHPTDTQISSDDTTTSNHGSQQQSYDRVIEILANLFIKTLDLSIRVKGAMDKSDKQYQEEGENKIAFDIISKNDGVSENSYETNFDEESFSGLVNIPEMIKLTPFDAVYIPNDESNIVNENNPNKIQAPIVVDIQEYNIKFNVSDGMVFEIDLSDLPVDKIARENEIKLRVRNFINKIKTRNGDKDMNDITSKEISLSDAIIKNITQIVLMQMDQAMKAKESKGQINNTYNDRVPGRIQNFPPRNIENKISIDLANESMSTKTVSPYTQASTTSVPNNGFSMNRLPSDLQAPTFLSSNDDMLTSKLPKLDFSSLNTPKPSEESTTSKLPKNAYPGSTTPTSYEDFSTSKLPTNYFSASNSSISSDIFSTSNFPDILFSNQTDQVINEVKNTISGIIKDVLSSQESGQRNPAKLEDIIEEIRDKVPDDVRIKSFQVDERQLQSKIKEAVGQILSADEIRSVVSLRNRSSNLNSIGIKKNIPDVVDTILNGSDKITDKTLQTSTLIDKRNNKPKNINLDELVTVSVTNNKSKLDKSPSTEQMFDNISEFNGGEITIAESEYYTLSPTKNQVLKEKKNLKKQDIFMLTTNPPIETEEDILTNTILSGRTITDTVISNTPTSSPSFTEISNVLENSSKFSVPAETSTRVNEIWKIILTASPIENDIIEQILQTSASEDFISPSPSVANDVQNIIQDGSLYADTSNSGVVRAKVVEDTSFARSIRPPPVGIAAILSIVIGVLALLCFSLMIFLAMARRRRLLEEMAPSTTAYTSTSRYTPEGTASNLSQDMKATYIEELSPNVSSSDLQAPDVVIQMDGHTTIIGSYEEFLDVPTGARPNILQSLPISPAATSSAPSSLETNVPRTYEMTDPELAFAPPGPRRLRL